MKPLLSMTTRLPVEVPAKLWMTREPDARMALCALRDELETVHVKAPGSLSVRLACVVISPIYLHDALPICPVGLLRVMREPERVPTTSRAVLGADFRMPTLRLVPS